MSVQQGKTCSSRRGGAGSRGHGQGSLPAVFSTHQVHFFAQWLLQLWCDHSHKIWLIDYCRGELQSMLRVTSIWSPHHCGQRGVGSMASPFLQGIFLKYLSFSIILFPFLQRTFPRVVQQRLRTSVCSRSCQDQKFISASDCWGTRNKNLRKCSWERVRVNRGLAGNRRAESKDLI